MDKINSSATATTKQDFQVHDPRFTSLPVRDVLKIRMKDLGMKNVDLQKILNYPAANVISMMKGGTMRVPESKAIKIADALQLDRIFLLGKVVAENSPELWGAVSTVLGDRLVTANELALINLIRAALAGHDVDLAQSPGFVQTLMPELKAILERQKALATAALERLDE